MVDADPAVVAANSHVLASVEELIRELQPGIQHQVETASIAAQLDQLQQQLENEIAGFSDDTLDHAIQLADEIEAGTKDVSDFASVLADLSTFQQSMDNRLQQ